MSVGEHLWLTNKDFLETSAKQGELNFIIPLCYLYLGHCSSLENIDENSKAAKMGLDTMNLFKRNRKSASVHVSHVREANDESIPRSLKSNKSSLPKFKFEIGKFNLNSLNFYKWRNKLEAMLGWSTAKNIIKHSGS